MMKDIMKMILTVIVFAILLLYLIISKYKTKEINYYFTDSLIIFSVSLLYYNTLLDIIFFEENKTTDEGLLYYSKIDNKVYSFNDYMLFWYLLLFSFYILYLLLPYQLCI